MATYWILHVQRITASRPFVLTASQPLRTPQSHLMRLFRLDLSGKRSGSVHRREWDVQPGARAFVGSADHSGLTDKGTRYDPSSCRTGEHQ